MLRKNACQTLAIALLTLAFGAACATDDDHLERMSREHTGDHPAATEAAMQGPVGEIETSTVVYADLDGTAVSGYLARPAGGAPAPGVLVIQEWWGLNDNIRAMADRLAGGGYIALAVDLYEGDVASDRDGARALVQQAMADPARLSANLRQARDHLVGPLGAIGVGTIGWCFGGGWSLRTALELGDGVDAAVMYYGRVVTDREQLEALSAPLLGHFGALDDGIPLADVQAMGVALEELGKDATLYVYESADHAFANPSGTRYQEELAELAWERTLQFFARHLG